MRNTIITLFTRTAALKVIIFSQNQLTSVVGLNIVAKQNSYNYYSCFIGPGFIKLRIEKNVFELSAILDTYNVSVDVLVTERLGIISFKDVSFILSAQETEMTSEVGKLQVMLGRVITFMIATMIMKWYKHASS